MRGLAFGGAVVLALAGGPALAQGIAVPEGIPPQPILDGPGEPGAPGWAPEGGGEGGGGYAGGGAARDDRAAGGVAGGGASGGAAVAGVAAGGPVAAPIEGGSQALNTLARQPYGQAAISNAQEVGVNPEATASIAQAESRFRNVPNASGTTTAQGVWQITNGTAADTVRMDRLGFTAEDLREPANQAVVANNVIRRYAAAAQNAVGREVSVGEVYNSYLMGPQYGPQIIAASNDTPLSAIVPARSLANNNMQGWSVGQLRGYSRNALGSAFDQPALLPGS